MSILTALFGGTSNTRLANEQSIMQSEITNLRERIVTLENWNREFLRLSTIEQDWAKELESRMNPDGTYQTRQFTQEVYTAMCAFNNEVPTYPKEKKNEKNQKARATTKSRVKPKEPTGRKTTKKGA